MRSPLYLEIIGSLSQNRNKRFLLQGPIMQRPGVYRLDIGFPEELAQYFSYQEKKGIIFWGIQVFSADNERQADFEITRVDHWEDLRIRN
ncbi:MAG: hypothetical protein CVV50_02045 [Spirochaetae bacterium HGW-Spirochaetae-6]|nr:MAG: hypothetical protein CVV50_02045 [Spirochaetae bacterium HGW-Spirochaetae-6]